MSGRRILHLAVLLIVLGLAAAPFLFHDTRSIQVAARICVFVALVASYDLLIGYTGIVSFAHTIFFGFGAYGTAIALKGLGPGWGAAGLGSVAGLAAAMLLAALVGLLSLRVKAIFFAMVTLAVASVMLVLASQLSGLTGGEDGLTYSTPKLLSPATALIRGEDGKVLRVLGTRMNGQLLAYYLVFLGSACLFALVLAVTRSPFGSVLMAIRENEARAEALGYTVVGYRTFAFALAAGVAALAGSLYALWLQYVGPDVTLDFGIMVDILLMVVIGGMGTLWGAVIGATLMVIAQYYLRDLMQAGAEATAGLPLLPQLMNPDRWLLWLGIVFILLVYFFPAGIAGSLTREPRR